MALRQLLPRPHRTLFQALLPKPDVWQFQPATVVTTATVVPIVTVTLAQTVTTTTIAKVNQKKGIKVKQYRQYR